MIGLILFVGGATGLAYLAYGSQSSKSKSNTGGTVPTSDKKPGDECVPDGNDFELTNLATDYPPLVGKRKVWHKKSDNTFWLFAWTGKQCVSTQVIPPVTVTPKPPIPGIIGEVKSNPTNSVGQPLFYSVPLKQFGVELFDQLPTYADWAKSVTGEQGLKLAARLTELQDANPQINILTDTQIGTQFDTPETWDVFFNQFAQWTGTGQKFPPCVFTFSCQPASTIGNTGGGSTAVPKGTSKIWNYKTTNLHPNKSNGGDGLAVKHLSAPITPSSDGGRTSEDPDGTFWELVDCTPNPCF